MRSLASRFVLPHLALSCEFFLPRQTLPRSSQKCTSPNTSLVSGTFLSKKLFSSGSFQKAFKITATMSENHRPAHDEPIYMNLKDFEDLRIEPDSNWPGTRGNSHWAGRESSVWYLSGDTDETSWTGWFKDKASMSDGEIEKFIRYARESRQLSSLEQFDTMGSPAPSDSETDTEDSAKGSESCCSGAEEDNLFSDKVGSADVDCPSEIDTAYAITPEESQLRKADEMLLLGKCPYGF